MSCSVCGCISGCDCIVNITGTPQISCPSPETCDEITSLGCVEYQGTTDLNCPAADTLYPAVTHKVVAAADSDVNRRLDVILGSINTQLCYLFSKPFISQLLTIIAADPVLSAQLCAITCNCQCGSKCNMPTNLTVGMQLNINTGLVNAILNWLPGGGPNASSQIIKYKLHAASTWTTATNTGSASTNTYTITGLSQNVRYDFLIENVCTNEALTDSVIVPGIYLGCPTPQFTVSGQNITVSFNGISTDITSYDIDLINSSGVTVSTFHIVPPFTTPVTHTFNSVTTGTYSVIIHQHVQDNTITVLKDCVYNNVATSQASCASIDGSSITVSLS